MRANEHQEFCALIAGVHDFYGKQASDFALSVWVAAMRPFELAAVRDALNRHVVNPDTGQFLPKPADVVRMIGGRTVDSALAAWAKVDRAMRTVGTYASVVFDDAVIHRVVDDMGGWILLGAKSDDDWPFVGREFENRYRGYAMRSEVPEYPRWLIGIAEAHNSRGGLPVDAVVLIGDEARARAVRDGGTSEPRLAIRRAGGVVLRVA